MKRQTQQAIGYSYIRFSSDQQRKGDSLRRQIAAAGQWCHDNGVTLDVSRSWHDLGTSAYLGDHRSNPDRHALAAFLKLVEDGRIAKGSFLIVESLDRLTREHVRAALMLCLSLIEKGIKIVQLSPAVVTYDDKTDGMALMMMIVELSRGHSESAVKSDRVGKAWGRKRELAREGKPMTKLVPAWLRLTPEKVIKTIPEAVAVVKRIFQMAIDGHGQRQIAAKLNEEGVPVISGKTAKWRYSYVSQILRSRAVLGEFASSVKGEAPIAGYYPAIITEDEWHQARAGAAERKNKGGRLSSDKDHVNIFAGLAVDARDQSALHCNSMNKGGKMYRHLYGSGSPSGTADYVGFDYRILEGAILGKLAEVDPAEIIGEEQSTAQEIMTLAGELETIDQELATIGAEMDREYSPTLLAVMRKKEGRRAEVLRLLDVARQRAASPVSQAWGECQSLVGLIQDAPDRHEVRVKIRSALRRVVDKMYCLFMPLGRGRLAAVQVHFHGGHRRDYIIRYKTDYVSKSKKKFPGFAWCRSGVGFTGDFDLRKTDTVPGLATALINIFRKGS